MQIGDIVDTDHGVPGVVLSMEARPLLFKPPLRTPHALVGFPEAMEGNADGFLVNANWPPGVQGHCLPMKHKRLTLPTSPPRSPELIRKMRELGLQLQVTTPFAYQTLDFPAGTLGEVQALGDRSVQASWHFGQRRKLWWIPLNPAHLCFGFSNGSLFRNFDLHNPTKPPTKFKPGQILILKVERLNHGRARLRRPVLLASGERVQLETGALLRCQEPTVFEVLQGNLAGSRVRWDPTLSLHECPHPWIAAGTRVRIRDPELTFRKHPLHEREGIVKIGTDADGDVGVEFAEDLGAGSLDGAGKDGHCLFVPARYLEEV